MATELDIAQAAGGIYAESLLQLAVETGEAELIGEQLADLRALWDAAPEFAAMMKSAAIDDDARRESLKKAFTGRVHAYVLNLLLVLNDKRRSAILPVVCDAYRRKLALHLNRQAVHVTTAVALDDDHRTALCRQVRRLTGREAELFERVDPEVLGGLTVQIGDRLYDTSTLSRLRRLRRALLSSVERHLLAGAERFVTEGP